MNELAYCAAYISDSNLLSSLVEKGANDFTWIACGAAEGGHTGIIDQIADNTLDWTVIVKFASLSGNKELVLRAIKEGANDFNIIKDNAKVTDKYDLISNVENDPKITIKIIISV